MAYDSENILCNIFFLFVEIFQIHFFYYDYPDVEAVRKHECIKIQTSKGYVLGRE